MGHLLTGDFDTSSDGCYAWPPLVASAISLDARAQRRQCRSTAAVIPCRARTTPVDAATGSQTALPASTAAMHCHALDDRPRVGISSQCTAARSTRPQPQRCSVVRMHPLRKCTPNRANWTKEQSTRSIYQVRRYQILSNRAVAPFAFDIKLTLLYFVFRVH